MFFLEKCGETIDFFILIEYNIMYNSQLYNTVYLKNKTVNNKTAKKLCCHRK